MREASVSPAISDTLLRLGQGSEKGIAYNDRFPLIRSVMKRPAFITGIAYIHLITVLLVAWSFQSEIVEKMPLFIGSALPVVMQWRWALIQLLLTAVLVIGLFLGHKWARWLLLATAIAGWAVAMPVRNASALPCYFIQLSYSIVILYLLFATPAAKTYFSRDRSRERFFDGRGLVVTLFHIVGIAFAYSYIWGLFQNLFSFTDAAIGMAETPAAAFVLGGLSRWNLTAACREVATALLAVGIFFLYLISLSFVQLHFVAPVRIADFDWMHTLLLSILVTCIGMALAVIYRCRTRPVHACDD